MLLRIAAALVLYSLLASSAAAQVVRFQTTMGDFDMVLNPTNNPRLQEHVDNMLLYVKENRYQGVWINRAADDFVLQMGSFYANTKRPSLTVESVRSMGTFAPTTGVPAASINGLSNTSGTVALALPGLPTGGTDRNAGTSSFFVNLASNTFLDADFTVFAAIPDLTVINEIMALPQLDRTTDPLFGADPNNLAFIDVPVQEDGFQVFIRRAFEVTDTLVNAQARAGVQSAIDLSAATFNGEVDSELAAATENLALTSTASTSASESASAMATVPEPVSALLVAAGIVGAAGMVRRRRRG